MQNQEIYQLVEKSYDIVNQKWMGLHVALLMLGGAVCAAMEIGIFLFMDQSYQENITTSYGTYWIKYAFIPAGAMLLLILAAQLVYKTKKMPSVEKQYLVSILYFLLSAVVTWVHSSFVGTLVCALFPILMTVMYENRKLTMTISGLTFLSQIFSGYIVFWDPDKTLNADYQINTAVLAAATVCMCVICMAMLNFMKMKRELVLNNEVERYRLQEKVQEDALTRVGNKRALDEYLRSVIKSGKADCFFVMMDIDGFKQINDRYGHLFGDDVLRCVGEVLKESKAGGSSFRYGGDEFSVIFSGMALKEVMEEIQKIQDALQEKIRLPDKTDEISLSAGVAAYHKGITAVNWIARADRALYEAKETAGSSIAVYENYERVKGEA